VCAADPGLVRAVIDLAHRKPRRLSMSDEIFASAVALWVFACSRLHTIAVMPFALKTSIAGRIITLAPRASRKGSTPNQSRPIRFACARQHVTPVGLFPNTEKIPVKVLVVRKQSLFNKLIRLRRISDITIDLSAMRLLAYHFIYLLSSQT
jgi:hypothetical protein